MHNLGAILEMNRDESNNMEEMMEDGIMEEGDQLVPDDIPDGESTHPVMNGESTAPWR